MRVRIGEDLSAARKLKGGSPQGSILGCFLYCITTQQISGELLEVPDAEDEEEGRPPDNGAEGGHVEHVPDAVPDASPPGMGILEGAVPGLMNSSSDSGNSDLIEPETANIAEGETRARPNTLSTFKYIDDTTVVEGVFSQGIRHIAAESPTEVVDAELLNGLIPKVVERAENIGMRVNCKKTQLLVVAPDNGYQTSTNVSAKGIPVPALKSIKLLGFVIDNDGGMAGQVEMIKSKFRRRLWTLIHLRRAGVKGSSLYKIYSTLVRPIIEANSVIYHPMLTRGQQSELERLQKTALKLCYGFHLHYAAILDDQELESLETRRVKAVKKFTAKIMTNQRFAGKWLERRAEVDTDIQRRRPFVEKKARTERYRRSPLMNIRRTANNIATAA